MGTAGQPTSANLQKLTSSLDNTGGIEQLMRLLFNGAIASNGFNQLGHYVRDEPLVSSCTNYATTPVPGCSSDFTQASATSASVASDRRTGKAAAKADRVVAQAVQSAGEQSRSGASMQGLLSFLMGSGQ